MSIETIERNEQQQGGEAADAMMLAFRAFEAERAAQAAAGAAKVREQAYEELRARLEFIQLGADALKGLGSMMMAEVGEFQMNLAFNSDAAAVFRFFGEALRAPANDAYDIKERLQRTTRGVEA